MVLCLIANAGFGRDPEIINELNRWLSWLLELVGQDLGSEVVWLRLFEGLYHLDGC